MAEGTVTYTGAWEIAGPEERAHVVRLCTALTGNSEVAEDLAQETLLEAWRHLDGLHTPHGRALARGDRPQRLPTLGATPGTRVGAHRAADHAGGWRAGR
jgi:hypothetical protein